MTEKVKLTREQADAVDSLLENIKGMRFTELFKAIQYGYEIKSDYKVGEWVVFATVTGDSYVGKVEGVEGGGILRTDIYAKAEVKQWFDGDSLRYATPEEIKAEKERRVWVKTGREVGEFKIDDVYRLKKYPHINIYIRNEEGLTNAEENHMNGAILGFYPAESFISFECE